MSYRAASCNAHAPSSAAKNRATINAAAAKCDVLLVQEADSQVVAALRDLDGWSHYTPAGLGGRNPIAWKTDKFELVTAGWSRIMANKAGVKDGPDRSMVWVGLREKATGRTVVHVNAHMIHQAFTSHKERRPQWFASLASLGAKAAILYARHRCPVVINADWNNPGKFNIPSVAEREVSSPATFGKRRYDRFFIVGKATASNVHKVATPSDHDTLVATITLGTQATPSPKPAPKPPAKEAPPVTKLPADLPKRLRAAGLTVVEIPGWKTRGRPGAFRPVGVLWHHTGGGGEGRAYADWLAKVGRSDLPAPLCQLSIDRRGTVYICAAGRANHAGKARASGTVAAGDGNSLYVGVECMNTGSEGWSTAQYGAMVATGSVLKDVLGTSVQTQRGHRETSVTGKWDPGKLDLDKFRADINRAAPTAEKDWFDMATEADLRRIVRDEVNKALGDVGEDVAKELLPGMDDAPKGRWLGSAISNIHNAVLRIEKKVDAK